MSLSITNRYSQNNAPGMCSNIQDVAFKQTFRDCLIKYLMSSIARAILDHIHPWRACGWRRTMTMSSKVRRVSSPWRLSPKTRSAMPSLHLRTWHPHDHGHNPAPSTCSLQMAVVQNHPSYTTSMYGKNEETQSKSMFHLFYWLCCFMVSHLC